MIGLLLLVGLSSAFAVEETCLSTQVDPYVLFGTKTAYDFANRGKTSTKAHDVPGCQPKAFWLLNRHGSHNPEAHELKELQQMTHMRDNIANKAKERIDTNKRMCNSDLEYLKSWNWNPRHNATYAGDITAGGYMTAQQLAQAWKKTYPGLLTSNRRDYLFKFVNDQKSSNTYRAFTEGLFGEQAEAFDIPKENDEKLLRPYRFCPAWTKEVEMNNATLEQLRIFESKQEYKQMIKNIYHRLGFQYDFAPEDVHRMYQLCRYNKAWDIEVMSAWCAVFTTEDLKLLEYAEDLQTYYQYGYGTAMNKDIGCTLVKDLVQFFSDHISGEMRQQPHAMIHFTDAAMMLMTLTALGARRDAVPLTGDNYHTNPVQKRLWATSAASPFNANIAAVLYQCTLNGNFQVKEEYQVLFLENQLPMTFEGCRVGLCDWSLVKNKYAELVSKCDLQFCNGADNIHRFTFVLVSVIVFVVTLIS